MKKVIICRGIPASGKAQPNFCKVLTPYGFRSMGELKVGNLVCTPDGNESKILFIHEFPNHDYYKISTTYGETFASPEHLWVTETKGNRANKTKGRIKDTLKIKNTLKSCTHNNHRLPRRNANRFISFNTTHIIHPYIMGALLGDGGLKGIWNSSLRFTNADQEIITKIKVLLPDDTIIKKAKNRDYDYYFSKPKRDNKITSLHKELIRLELKNKKSSQKHIPIEYLYDSVKNRIELLKGLMDTDGYCDKLGYPEYYTTSSQLRDDFIFLIKSLGGVAKWSTKNTTSLDCYVVSFKLEVNPFFVERKANRFKLDRKYGCHDYIKNIEYIGKADSRCIEIESNDGLYITDDFIVTHNSTWAKQFVKENKNWVRIGRDDFRHMLNGYQWNEKIENLIGPLLYETLKTMLQAGFNVIVDNTNLKMKYVNEVVKVCEGVGDVQVEEKLFSVSLKEAIERNSKRDTVIPVGVIENMYKSWTNMKSFETLYCPPIESKPYTYDTNPGLTPIVICDIDGTLALFGNKNPYDRDFINDDVNPVVKRILDAEAFIDRARIVLFSGRDDKFRAETVDWLQKYSIPFHELHMRKQGDGRRDTLVKLDMYNEIVKDKYSVLYVIDDRDQVVALWRSLGLWCLQVNYGNF